MRRVLLVCSWFLCLVLGTAIEHFQAFLVHHSDVTDVILYSTEASWALLSRPASCVDRIIFHSVPTSSKGPHPRFL